MASKLTELAIDCRDPRGLARFWCSVLDYEVQDDADGLVTTWGPFTILRNGPGGAASSMTDGTSTATYAYDPDGSYVEFSTA